VALSDRDSEQSTVSRGSSILRVGQVPNPKVRWLFEYWDGQRNERRLMPRQSFDPVHLGGMLSNVLFVERHFAPPDLRIRVAGQEVEDRYGRSMRGMSIYETFPIVKRKDTSHQWAEILADGQPKYRRGPMLFPNDRAFEAERLLLPLSDGRLDGREEVAYILGLIFYAPLLAENLTLTAVSATLIG
jgi:hypothetical protein